MNKSNRRRLRMRQDAIHRFMFYLSFVTIAWICFRTMGGV
ncbi:hypothetical protein M2222_003853 [Bradyrhizobium elkanii]|jgi:hypothetical protein|nr:hypothetical protein [Bradyrhizobium elkanii]MCS3561531.1 hypothetical protein [Bradyrhizobium elkanii]MCW2148628.1 hypothetical protein [Bradyrhizobium elkanii]MCW2352286.1 hypothetical protein [Bradyrhizobium elkanii]MCW2372356.1 hypothetical protein [Bradyrhizobium elkanii]